MRNTVYFFVFDGYADWEAALALCEIRRPGDFRVRTVALERRPVQSMGGLTVLPDLSLDEIDDDHARLVILPGGTAWERGEIGPVSATLRRLHADGTPIGALCSGVLALAYAGLVDTRRHTGNYAGHIETYVPDYARRRALRRRCARAHRRRRHHRRRRQRHRVRARSDPCARSL